MSTGRVIEDDLVKLESQDADLHKELVETLDSLIFKSINTKLDKEFSQDDDTLLDEEIRKEMAELKDFDPNILSFDGEFNLDDVEKYLQNMVKIRNNVVEQQLISDAYEDETADKQSLEEVYTLSKEKTSTVNELSDNIKKLKEMKISNKIKLEKIQEQVTTQKELKQRSSYTTSDVSDADIAEVKNKYKKIIGKNLMLGHFIMDLIAALNSANISNDEKLLEILMDCGDYTDYDLFYE